jgi:hypothetical protein
MRNLLVARDAQNHAVVKLGLAAIGVSANVVRVERLTAKIAAAALTFAVSGNEELSDLARREETASVAGCHDRWLPGSHRIRTTLANGPDTSCLPCQLVGRAKRHNAGL